MTASSLLSGPLEVGNPHCLKPDSSPVYAMPYWTAPVSGAYMNFGQEHLRIVISQRHSPVWGTTSMLMTCSNCSTRSQKRSLRLRCATHRDALFFGRLMRWKSSSYSAQAILNGQHL